MAPNDGLSPGGTEGIFSKVLATVPAFVLASLGIWLDVNMYAQASAAIGDAGWESWTVEAVWAAATVVAFVLAVTTWRNWPRYLGWATLAMLLFFALPHAAMLYGTWQALLVPAGKAAFLFMAAACFYKRAKAKAKAPVAAAT